MTYRTRTGKVLTDADIEQLAAEAEQGYDLSRLHPRMTRLQQVVAAIELAQTLEKEAGHFGLGQGDSMNTGWMPFNLFDFDALLFEALPMIGDAGRFLDVGAGPGSKMVLARDVYGLEAHGIEIQPALAAMGQDAGLAVQAADAGDWTGYGKHDCIWLNRPRRDPEAERFLEERIWREMAPGAVILCANTATRPPASWIIVSDSWDDLQRGSWVKPYTDETGSPGPGD